MSPETKGNERKKPDCLTSSQPGYLNLRLVAFRPPLAAVLAFYWDLIVNIVKKDCQTIFIEINYIFGELYGD